MGEPGTPRKKIVLKKRTKGSSPKRPLKRKIKAQAAPAEASPPDEESPDVHELEAAGVGTISEPAKDLTAPDQFEFFCPYCAKQNLTGVNQVDEAIFCVSCGNTITVPPPLAAPPSKKKSQRIAFKFFCSVCGQKLSATPEQVGTHTVCPSCNSSITVPELQPAPPESKDTQDGDAGSGEGLFKFHCPECSRKFEAKRSWAGRLFACPSCHAEVTVPSPPD